MAQPFHYDNYVKSQIGMGYEFDNQERGQIGSQYHNYNGSIPRDGFKPTNQAPNKLNLRSRFNQLVDLCRNENVDINSDFQNVMGAQKEILQMLKGQLSKQPSGTYSPTYQPTPQPYSQPNGYSQYVRSNVEHYGGPSPNYQANYQNPYPDKATFLKSKIQDLAEENRQLRGNTRIEEQLEEDPQIMQLQKEISRLRSLIPQYEAQISKLKVPKHAKLMQLLEQGQRIRQDTIRMLRADNSDCGGDPYFMEELEDLRRKCKQLQGQNTRLKRMSKGTELTQMPYNYYS